MKPSKYPKIVATSGGPSEEEVGEKITAFNAALGDVVCSAKVRVGDAWDALPHGSTGAFEVGVLAASVARGSGMVVGLFFGEEPEPAVVFGDPASVFSEWIASCSSAGEWLKQGARYSVIGNSEIFRIQDALERADLGKEH